MVLWYGTLPSTGIRTDRAEPKREETLRIPDQGFEDNQGSNRPVCYLPVVISPSVLCQLWPDSAVALYERTLFLPGQPKDVFRHGEVCPSFEGRYKCWVRGKPEDHGESGEPELQSGLAGRGTSDGGYGNYIQPEHTFKRGRFSPLLCAGTPGARPIRP